MTARTDAAALLASHAIRARIEEQELRLAPLAAKARYSRGREQLDEPSPMRTLYQQDRDRIVHSKAFRRLKHKTQVFIAPLGDHYITRLTHAIQVAQIARSVARALNLNEDLTEAIALSHDLGHPPFGHAGEEALNEVVPGGFRHAEQTLRVVERLEKDGAGLNLAWEVRDALATHSKAPSSLEATPWGVASTLEGQVVSLADGIAYINHDIEDAIRADLIAAADLPRAAIAVLGERHAERINAMVCDIIATNWERIRAGESSVGQTVGDYRRLAEDLVQRAERGERTLRMSPAVREATDALRGFLFERVYWAEFSRPDMRKARDLVQRLYTYFCTRPETLPPEFARALADEPVERVVCDYVSGMTDRFALQTFEDLFVPRLWSVVG
ncbi:MAG: deoxyguanosinetriphosphate triphosphohydrolase [Chloroflexi bacterium]|nr:deoxyguanosinetriphosphate triphosphohydrolase [Chloroflexota bacterium]